jgi:hypothetical protein
MRHGVDPIREFFRSTALERAGGIYGVIAPIICPIVTYFDPKALIGVAISTYLGVENGSVYLVPDNIVCPGNGRKL